MICSVWTPRAELRELRRPRPEGHHDLLQRRVAGALAEAVDRHLDLARAGLDRRERVGRGEAEVVVAVDADRRLAADEVDDPPDERAELGRDRVADGVRDVDGRRAGLDDGLVDLEQEVGVGAGGVLGAELDLGVAAERLAAVADPADGLAPAPVSRSIRSLCLRWMSLVAMKTWRCGRSATLIASIARCGSPSRQRASAATAIALRLRAIRWTASKSPGDAAGKPASMTSTFSRTSWRATSSFSAAVSPAPGACSPSRRVVSKIRTRPAGRAGRRGAVLARAITAVAPGGRGRRPGPAPACDVDRVEERHLAAQLGADLLDLVVVVGRAEALELGPARLVLGDPACGEGAVLDLGQDLPSSCSRTCSSMIRGPET